MLAGETDQLTEVHVVSAIGGKGEGRKWRVWSVVFQMMKPTVV